MYLEVEVSDPLGVQVVDSIQDLLEELRGLLLAQGLLLCQEVEELASGHPGRGERRTGRGEREKVRSLRSKPATNPRLTQLS